MNEQPNGSAARQSGERESWEQQALDHGWIPPQALEAWKHTQQQAWNTQEQPQQDEQEREKPYPLVKIVLVCLAAIFLVTRCYSAPSRRSTKNSARASTSASTATEAPGSRAADYALTAQAAIEDGTLTAAEIKHRADALGWSAEEWQQWYFIAGKLGMKMETVEEAAMHVNQQFAVRDPAFLASLSEIGITEEDAESMRAEELFSRVMEGLQSLPD